MLLASYPSLLVMNRYLTILVLATMVLIISAYAWGLWLVDGLWRLVKKIGRTGRNTRIKRGTISS